ncbi:MAG: amino acid ABC transporter permease [Thermomicrobiales bacterium]
MQLIYIYFVLPTIGIRLNPFVAGIVGLSLNYSAYLSEVYRSGIQAIPRGQLDAAAALGMRPSITMRRIVLPQAIRIVIPPLGNYFVALFKDTSLVLCSRCKNCSLAAKSSFPERMTISPYTQWCSCYISWFATHP